MVDIEKEIKADIKLAVRPVKTVSKLGMNHLGERLSSRYPKDSLKSQIIISLVSSAKK